MATVYTTILCITAVEVASIVSAAVAGDTQENTWYQQLQKPTFMPPGWVFGLVWPLLYALLGVILAQLWMQRPMHNDLNPENAAKAGGTGGGTQSRLRSAGWSWVWALMILQLLLNLLWSPLFFRFHALSWSLYLLWTIFGLSLLATFLMLWIPGLIYNRWVVVGCMVPYLLWLVFAGALQIRLVQLNT